MRCTDAEDTNLSYPDQLSGEKCCVLRYYQQKKQVNVSQFNRILGVLPHRADTLFQHSQEEFEGAEPVGTCSLVFLLWVCRLEDGAAAAGSHGSVLCAGDSDFVAFKSG